LVRGRQSIPLNRLLTTNDQPPATINPPKVYNSAVNARVPPKPAADNAHHDEHRRHHAIYAAEATGLLLMAVLLLVLTIIRYWRYIPWGAR
jgi:hypothetical protein